MLTGQPAVPPGPATDDAIHALFRIQHRTDEEEHQLQAALATAKSHTRKLRVTLRHVAKQLQATRAAAGHGPSGWRNSYILLIGSDPEGATALGRWVQVWADAAITPWAAELLTAAIARPFYKDENRLKIRPVLCGEALYKFAMGLVVRATAPRTAAACGPRQYALQSGGASKEVFEVRAAARAWPMRPLIAIDVRNAFGALSWPVALAAAAAVPALAAAVAAAWAPGRTRLWTAAPDGTWTGAWLSGSVIQGNPEGSPLYCLVAAKVSKEFRSAPALRDHLGNLHDWQFVDDWVLQPEVASAVPLLDSIQTVLADHGLEMQEAKCQFHIPSGSSDGAPLPAALQPLAARIRHSADALTLLGSTAGGAYSAPLHMPSVAPPATVDRLDHALRLCRRASLMVDAAPPCGGRQPAFALARTVIAHALDYDAGVLPCSLVLPHAQRLDQAVRDLVCHTADISPDERSLPLEIQLALPRRLGGMQVAAATTVVPCARVAALLTHGQHVRDQVAAWQAAQPDHELPEPARLDGVDDEKIALLDALRALGIEAIAGSGRPCPAGTGADDPLRAANPDSHLLSHFLKAADAHAHGTLVSGLSACAKANLWSAGGPSAGSSITAPLCLDGVHFADWQWTEVVRYRLSLPTRGPQQLCKNERADGTCCEVPLDPLGNHATDCTFGPLRNRRHDDLAEVYADIIQECGGIARREVFVPEFSASREAWLDVWAYGTPELPDLLLDLSVRNPGADRYRVAAGEYPGAAAAAGELEKDARYPPAGGRRVWPVIYETRGRAGLRAEELLQQLAAVARRRAHRRGRAVGQELQRWRARLDGSLQRGIAAQLVASRLGMPGRRLHSRRPLDLAALEAGTPV